MDRQAKPTLGVLAGWQFYRTATNLSYLTPVFRGISRATQDLGCSLLLGCGMGPSASPADPLRPAWPVLSPEVDFVPIGPWNTQGILFTNPLHAPERSQYAQDLIAAGHPVVFIGAGEAGPTIVADNTGGTLEAMRHLVDHGHRRIAFIAGSLEDMSGDTGDRLAAYQAALEMYGLQADPRLVVYGRHVYDGGQAAMEQILESGAAFTAVLASNDESAMGAMRALKEAGRRIPEDVAVIGFDNRPESAVQEPPLSSIHISLFQMGYRSVELLLQRIEGNTPPAGVLKVETRLVARSSCGCGLRKTLPTPAQRQKTASLADPAAWRTQLAGSIAARVLSQAQNMTDAECRVFCQRLVDAFTGALERGDRVGFQQALEEVLERTAAVEDDPHIWQEAISILAEGRADAPAQVSSSAAGVEEILDQARLTISARMQRQHRQYVVNERQKSSRLSLLTARLLTALDETRIYAVIAQHLPDMDVHLALLAQFEAEGDDPVAWTRLRSLTDPAQPPLRFHSRDFPPEGLFDGGTPFHLTLIPLVDQSGQLGFVVFGVEYFDLYGAIVQQLAGASNTARLYRQATEGRRLAEEANHMKSRFLSTISHELRTPLNLIVGLSGITLQESEEGVSPLPPAAQHDVERIHAYAQHLGGLIGDVLDLATSDAGQLRLNNELVDLGEALRMVAESGRQLAADKKLAWNASLPESGPWVWGDRTRLRQVALNLINNAVKFTPRGGVSMLVESGAGTVTVSVQDTGLGIPQDEQQAIFDEFRRSERSISRGYSGLGLGLAICKRLVEMHGGEMGVQSSGEEGGGSTFYFNLPTVPRPTVPQKRPPALQPAEQSVLVLTNRTGAGERLGDHLGKRGVQVQVALLDLAADWEASVAASPPDAIVLDICGASEQSWDTLSAIKASPAARGIPVFFYTSTQNGESVLELDYLTKPVELAELTRALDQHWPADDPDHPARTFLVVDDEPNTLEMQARIAQAHSASNRILKARSGREALDLLRQERIDLVMLDLQMPEIDGFGVLEAMREQESTREIPVIVVTGKILTEADMARLNRGVAVVLEKGLFSIDETLAHIGAALERKRRLSGEAQRLVRIAMAYLHERFADPVSRRDIAQHVGITEDYLTFCFRQELGTTPVEYLQRYRVNQAKRLLKDSQKSITEIGLEVGFSDSGYFSRIFRRETGMSPEAYRRG